VNIWVFANGICPAAESGGFANCEKKDTIVIEDTFAFRKMRSAIGHDSNRSKLRVPQFFSILWKTTVHVCSFPGSEARRKERRAKGRNLNQRFWKIMPSHAHISHVMRQYNKYYLTVYYIGKTWSWVEAKPNDSRRGSHLSFHISLTWTLVVHSDKNIYDQRIACVVRTRIHENNVCCRENSLRITDWRRSWELELKAEYWTPSWSWELI